MAFTATPGSWTPINIWAMLRNLINQNTPIVTNAGAPTNGAAGTYFNQAGIGALLIDTTNGNLYINTGTLASPTWTLMTSAVSSLAPTALTTNGAIAIATANYAITKAGVYAGTLAAPVAVTNDGVLISITSDTANAHTITFTGSKLDSGSAAALTATFNAQKGASLTVEAYNARWKVISANGVSFS